MSSPFLRGLSSVDQPVLTQVTFWTQERVFHPKDVQFLQLCV